MIAVLDANELRQQALEATRASRDFAPKDGRRFSPAELDELGCRCKAAVIACDAAGTTIAQMRLELWQKEREEFRVNLEALARRAA
jgi:hypothetical protein